MDSTHCRIALIQTSAESDISRNISRAERMICQAAGKGARIICLPELFSTRYFPQHIGLDMTLNSEPADGPFISRFSTIAQNEGIVLIIPFCEKGTDSHIYNAAMVIDADGTSFSPYHKVHLPQDPCFYEKSYFTPGNEYQVYKTKYGTISVLICYDQWFPEAARTVALMGAELIFYPTAIGHIRGEIPGEGNWKEAWQLIQRSHAIANSVPVAAVNRCGIEDEIDFFGGSFVCDAFGTMISHADDTRQIVYADLDLSAGLSIREGWGFFRNRRTDTYQSLVSVPEKSRCLLTPINQGYHMPAEWEMHEAVWLAWPHNNLTFPHLQQVRDTFLDIIAALLVSEHVHLLVTDSKTESCIIQDLVSRGIDTSSITFHIAPYSDVWIRDYGPVFVVNRAIRQISAVCWNFNAWGNKYDDLLSDGNISGYISSKSGIFSFVPGIVLEGGSIDVNGRGSVLTTKQCLLNSNRNPQLTQDEIEGYLLSYLSASNIIWLEEGITGDDTDGHIDDIARFVGPSTIVCALEDDPTDDNYKSLQENFKILSSAKDQDNKPFTVIPVPMPGKISDDEYRYPASYLNFYISNTVVLVPIFNDPHDDEALEVLKGLFPDRSVIGIDSRFLIEGFGAIHCATQQQPRFF
ncbi:MAG: peptidyl-arginine deiminase [Methanomicrobiales archaeon]|nr:peptidyl-arginine deiminase [Methanomicrobiales archaeon]